MIFFVFKQTSWHLDLYKIVFMYGHCGDLHYILLAIQALHVGIWVVVEHLRRCTRIQSACMYARMHICMHAHTVRTQTN